MKKRFSRKINKNNFFKIIIILFSIILIYKIITQKRSGLENFISNVSYPFLVVCNKIVKPLEAAALRKKNYAQLLSDNIILREDNEKLLQENIELKSLINFDEKSKDLLDFKKRYALENVVFANIILKNISHAEQYFLINKGKNHGIEKDMVAIYKFQIIGKISDVSKWHSKITLITDKKNKISAYSNKTHSNGIVEGSNDINKLNFSFVSHLSELELEDFVISSGKGLVYPEGFCLGKITNIEKQDLYYKVNVEPLVKIEELENCLITSQEIINDSFQSLNTVNQS